VTSGTPRDGARRLHDFMKALLADVNALEAMLDSDLFERGVRRIGCELEIFFVDAEHRPAPVATEVVPRVGDPRLTYELARFNAEINGTPLLFEGACLAELERELAEVLREADRAATELGARAVLAGILPSLSLGSLGIDRMTPTARYRTLNEVVSRMRGGSFSMAIHGLDELEVTHDNVLLEACATSFQLHYQVAPEEFARMYNIAQVVTAPVLAAATNSPVLFGRRLWQETRLPLFDRSVDMRSPTEHRRQSPSRVSFGDAWLRGSVTELYKEQIARYRVLLPDLAHEDPMADLAAGRPPPLTALQRHNGTVWRWNRACYGVAGDRAHLRIENRALPAGPSLVDQLANAALYYGLLTGVAAEIADVTEHIGFGEAKQNFFTAGRFGLKGQLTWLDGRTGSTSELLLGELIPLARSGLTSASISADDIDRYLGIIEERVRRARTGAHWVLQSLDRMNPSVPTDLQHRRLVAELLRHQASGRPVHEWELAEPADDPDWSRHIRRVDEFMTRDVFTVRPQDLVDLVASVMDWKHVRYVPVEDDDGRLVGLITHRALLRLVGRGHGHEPVAVRDIMVTELVTVPPTCSTLEAMQAMRTRCVGCLLVVDDGRLIGMVTQTDLMRVTAALVEAALRER
jgi:CBS domain-containing protein